MTGEDGSSGSRRPTWSPTNSLVCPGMACTSARADGTCAAVNVGVRPTFGTGRAVLVEAYILDREDVELYGRNPAGGLLGPAARRAQI